MGAEGGGAVLTLPHPHHRERDVRFLGVARIDRILHLEESHGESGAEDRADDELAAYHIDCHRRSM